MYKEFSKALSSMADNIARSMGPGFRLSEGWTGPIAKKIAVDEAVQVLLKSKNIVFLTGAGLSAASGIPTFRGEGGFWRVGEDEYEAQKVLTYRFF